jgi:protein phosphatase
MVMSRLEPKISCTNPQCAQPLNAIEAKVCAHCGTTITRRYLWAVGDSAASRKVGATTGNARYYVTAPNVWLDLEPQVPPTQPPELDALSLAYLYLYPQRLHVPEFYGLSIDGRGEETILLDRAAVNASGEPLPTIVEAWKTASATRQVYWLWQLLQLWSPLHQWDAVGSLLDGNLIRVEDWCIRLQELQPSHPSTDLSDLASIWQIWLPAAKPAILPDLTAICQQMQQPDVTIEPILQQLNQLLLQQAAQVPLRLQVFGATDTGKSRSHNEDSCYPIGDARGDELTARLAIVCDGIGGHEGGEVASQMALRLLRPQIQALLTEIAEQAEIVPPELVYDQLQAMARVVNNVISGENDAQERESRRRMGTTLMLALQLPQRIKLPSGAVSGNAHELYLMSVGDSRAYWLTAQTCQRLTIDDDVAAREVKMGRLSGPDAARRPDAGALTQALGMRDGEFLRPNLYRYILEEDGLLLIASDGLSDRDLIEQHWATFTEPVLRGRMDLETAVNGWIKLANEHNGTDNISVVLSRVEVSIKPSLNLSAAEPEVGEADLQDLALADEPAPIVTPEPPQNRRRWRWTLLLLPLLAAAGVAGWSQADPSSFNPVRDRVQTQLQEWRQQFLP